MFFWKALWYIQKMKQKPFWIAVFGLIFLLLIFFLRQQISPVSHGIHTLLGETMGTTYQVLFRGELPNGIEEVQKRIDSKLQEINDAMSTWKEDSEISKINRAPAGEWIPISKQLYPVLKTSLDLSRKTGGAFDITVGPIANLLGFGPTKPATLPTPHELEEASHRVGYLNLEIESQRIEKKIPDMYLDVSGIAPGYGVDALATVLREYGITHYSVEIGGEVAVQGTRGKKAPWVVGIEKPLKESSPYSELIHSVSMTHGALATSGTYRTFKKYQGGEISHIIDPRSGKPTQTDLVSVTVYAPTCMEADGIATALMVLGVEEGMLWVEKQEGIEALFIRAKVGSNRLEQVMSSGFKKLIQDGSAGPS